MIPNGQYLFRPMRELAEFGNSGVDGTTQQVCIPFKVVENGQFKGQVVAWTGTFKAGDAVRITMETLRTMGWDGSKPISELRGVGLKDVHGTIENDPQYGPKIKNIKEPGKMRWQGGLMSKEQLASLDSIVDQASAPQARRSAASYSRPQTSARPTGATEWDGQGVDPNGSADDSDVPF